MTKAKVPTSIRQVLAENVEALMHLRFEEHGDKIKVLAKKSGVSRSTAQRIVNAQHATNVDTIEAIAKALDVPAHLLLVKLSR